MALVVAELRRYQPALLDLLVEEDLEVAVGLGLALALYLVLPERQGFDLCVARVGDVHQVTHVVQRSAVLVESVLLADQPEDLATSQHAALPLQRLGTCLDLLLQVPPEQPAQC